MFPIQIQTFKNSNNKKQFNNTKTKIMASINNNR